MRKITTALFVFLFFALGVVAASREDIVLPAKELGNCKTEAECRQFCDVPENRKGVCWEFAKKYNLVTKEEITEVEKIENVFRSGLETPGGCRGKDECYSYCQNQSHLQVCLDFAVKQGVVTQKEAEETKKFVSLAKSGSVPGGLGTKEECLAYCREDGHLEECLSFAEKAGYISGADLAIIRKTGGKGPGGCTSKAECENYCSNPSNQQACLSFAKEHGIQVSSFKGPGGCSDIDSCTSYCKSNPSDSECKKYSDQYGGGFKGPGGCTDQTSCTSYCQSHYSDPECAQYSGQYGGQQQGGFKGPGGCTSMESCMSYCKSNLSDPECQKYAGQYGGSDQTQQPPQ